MARFVRIWGIVCLVLALASGAPACSRRSGNQFLDPGTTPVEELPEPPAQLAFVKAPPPGQGVESAFHIAEPGTTGNDASRKIIRNATLTLEVSSLDAALERLRKDTASAGGYIASESHRTVANGVRSAEVACRVPVARLDASLRDWRTLGREEAFSLATEDITAQYSDSEVTLRNQQKLETRLLELLNRQTNHLGDLLEIEKEAARVRSEIETLEARKRLWDQQVALASIVVTLHEPRPAVAAKAGGTLHTLGHAFLLAADNFVDTVASTIAALGTIVPLLVVLVIAWRIVRALWRRGRGKRQ
jgi:hypothetical protein